MAGTPKKGEVFVTCKAKNLQIKLDSGAYIKFSENQAFVTRKEADELLEDPRAIEFEIKERPHPQTAKKSAPEPKKSPEPKKGASESGGVLDDAHGDQGASPTIAPKRTKKDAKKA